MIFIPKLLGNIGSELSQAFFRHKQSKAKHVMVIPLIKCCTDFLVPEKPKYIRRRARMH